MMIEELKEKFKKYDNPDYHLKLIQKYPKIADLKRAAVLIPINFRKEMMTDGTEILKSYFTFSKRSEMLNSFKGQVCFMGGKHDEMDKSAVETAFRESKEEANINECDLTVLCQLCPMVIVNTMLVTPVVVYFDKSNFEPRLNPNEVDYIFELPTDRFLSKESHTMNTIENKAGNNHVHYFKDYLNGKEIVTWGFTAFLASVVSSLLHSRAADFDLTPNLKLDHEKINEFLEKYLLHKLAVV